MAEGTQNNQVVQLSLTVAEIWAVHYHADSAWTSKVGHGDKLADNDPLVTGVKKLEAAARSAEAVVKREVVESGVTCPRRVREPGPWEHEEGLDNWEKRGPDRCCSFCGGIHPQDFLALMRQAADPESDVRIEQATGKSKWYITRKEVPTGAEGGMKTYGVHLVNTEWTDEIQAVLPKATILSKEKFEKYFEELKKRRFSKLELDKDSE